MGNALGCPTWLPGCGQRPDRDNDGTQKVSPAALARQTSRPGSWCRWPSHPRAVEGGHEKLSRRTVIDMSQGVCLAEHEDPGEAAVRVGSA